MLGTLKLEAVIASTPGWAEAFGSLVWAKHLKQEPAWPSVVIDPRTFGQGSPPGVLD